MKRYLSIYPLIGLLAFLACKKEENPVASADIADAFIRHDNTVNEADHQIYLYYQESGIPVLYSDTLTTDPVTTLRFGYNLTSLDSLITFTRLQHNTDILEGLAFVKTQVIPYLGPQLKPYSVFLTDSLYSYTFDYYGPHKVLLNAYQGLNTLAIGYVPSISKLDGASLRKYRGSIFKTLLAIPMGNASALLDNFYAVSAAFYNKSAYGTDNTPYYIPYQAKEAYGLLSDGSESTTYYATGSQTDDLNRYLDVVLSLSEAEFTATYSSYPLVMDKYRYFKEALTALGFTMPQ